MTIGSMRLRSIGSKSSIAPDPSSTGEARWACGGGCDIGVANVPGNVILLGTTSVPTTASLTPSSPSHPTQVVLPLLLGDLVKTTCDNTVQPPVCTDDPTTSWVTTTQFYAGLGIVQVWIIGCETCFYCMP